MKLDWIYNPDTKIATVELPTTPALKYETPDGGQTINKFEDGILVDTFHKFGPDTKFHTFNTDPGCGEPPFADDGWPAELHILANRYPHIVGPWNNGVTTGYLDRNGDLVDVGKNSGPIVGADQPITINRLAISGSVQGWWGWDEIAVSSKKLDATCYFGIHWLKNQITGKIIRTGSQHPQVPCCMFPMVHGPFEVDESDISLHDGVPPTN